MYQQLPLETFLETLGKFLQRGSSGTVFMIGEGGEWGKIIVENGMIISIGFQMKSGVEALPGIKKLREIQFEVHPSKKTSAAAAMRVKPQMSLEEFFGFFDMPQIAALVRRGGGAEPSVAPPQTAPPSATAPSAAAPVAAVRKGAPKVLVVDDSALARKAASLPLVEAGYTVVEAHDGFEALGQLQNEQPDLVILDLIMPGIDGYKVLELIKGNKDFAEIPVIMLTSRDSLLDKLKGKMSSTDEYLTKPFSASELVESVRKYLRP